MNAFELAQSVGFDENSILKFLAKANPQISDALSKAIKLGYSTEDVFNYLSKAMNGAKVNPKFQKRVFSQANEANIHRRAQNVPVDAGKATQLPIIGGLVGAGVGFATGGPIGALAGGISGYGQLDKLSKAYEEHTRSGGEIPFTDFISNLAIGSTIAGLGGSQVKPLRELAKNYIASLGSEAPQTPGAIGNQTSQAFGGQGIQGQPQEASQESGAPQAAPTRQEGQSYLGRALEGKDFSSLDPKVKNRVVTLGRKLEEFQNKGLPYDDPKVQRVVERVNQILGNAKTGTVARETERFNKEYQDTETESIEETEEIAPEQKLNRDIKENTLKGRAKISADPNQFENVFKIDIPKENEIKSIDKPTKSLQNSLKSSNVSGVFYDDKTNKMRIIFKSGSPYEYENATIKELEQVIGGKAKPITEGANQYGFWFPEKNKSVGAAFNKFIKKKEEEFPFRPLEKKELKPEELQAQESQRTFNVTNFFEPFKKLRKKGQQHLKGQVLKELVPAMKNMDDEEAQAIVAEIEEKLGLKNPATIKRLLKEIEKRPKK